MAGISARWLVAGVLVVAGIAVLATPLRSSISDLVADDSSDESPPEETSAAPSSADPEPALTAADRRAAKQVVLRYGDLQRFTGARRPPAKVVAPWTSDDGAVLLGAEVEVALSRKRSIEARWPSVAFAGPRRYVSRPERFRADQVTSLTLLVDLRRRAVVSVEPDPGAKVVRPKGAPAESPPPANED